MNDFFYQDIDSDGDGVADGYFASMDTDGDGISDTAMVFIDTNQDGIFDTQIVAHDLDGDGSMEMLALTDAEGDGFYETMALFQDTSGDGEFDTVLLFSDADGDFTYDTVDIWADTDQSGALDYHAQEQYIDSAGTGVIDTVIFREDVDLDDSFDSVAIYRDADGAGDFQPVAHYEDVDGDGYLDLVPMDDLAGYDNELSSGVERGSEWDIYQNYEPGAINPAQIIGRPDLSLRYWELQEGNTCALHSQRGMVEELTHRDLDIDDMVRIAEGNHWYSDEVGTILPNLSRMLDYYHVENSGVMANGNVDTLIQCLNNNGRMVVALNSDIIWHDDDGFPDGHAVEVIGFNTGANPNSPHDDMVIINDSGHPDGQGAMVPLAQFMEAWNWSGNVFVEAYAV
jgi:hypothetical protein